ncbi:unnamed protein product [Adineta ricciae]|uniref:FAS1 domain-containing protein n=1 Tax=Adineta ricciae TaxID=249248 RepID=A0A813R007_ADIRI|nr:unnamed protein product [Adineta ricciae]
MMNSSVILMLFLTLLHNIDIVTGDNVLKAAGAEEASQQAGSFTVSAPTDSAFAKILQEIVQRLLDPKNRDQLDEILFYHAIGNKSNFIAIIKQRTQIKTNNATVVASNIMANK